MDPRFQSSFIPKKPIVAQQSSLPSTVNLFALIATILFILALALSGGAFFYKGLLVKQIQERRADFELAQAAYEPGFIQQVTRLDARIETAKGLLSSHTAVTPLFDAISRITLQSVRFRDFNFSYAAQNQITVTMKGQAQSYASVALQSDEFNKQRYLKDTIIGDMALEPSGMISFNVSTVIDPKLLAYSPSAIRTQPIVETPAASTSTPATSTPQLP